MVKKLKRGKLRQNLLHGPLAAVISNSGIVNLIQIWLIGPVERTAQYLTNQWVLSS